MRSVLLGPKAWGQPARASQPPLPLDPGARDLSLRARAPSLLRPWLFPTTSGRSEDRRATRPLTKTPSLAPKRCCGGVGSRVGGCQLGTPSLNSFVDGRPSASPARGPGPNCPRSASFRVVSFLQRSQAALPRAPLRTGKEPEKHPHRLASSPACVLGRRGPRHQGGHRGGCVCCLQLSGAQAPPRLTSLRWDEPRLYRGESPDAVYLLGLAAGHRLRVLSNQWRWRLVTEADTRGRVEMRDSWVTSRDLSQRWQTIV